MPTRYQLFVEKWSGGCGSTLCHAKPNINMVHARGSIPCDVLFVGEAPGPSENCLRAPFVGPAGKLLDQIIQEGLVETVPTATWAFTNLVCCMPLGEDGTKFAEPPREAIKKCSRRLVEFVRICQPTLVIMVGALSRKYIVGAAQFRLDGKDEQPEWIQKQGENAQLHFAEIVHPAAILRTNVANQGLAIRRCVITLRNAAEKALIPF